LFNLKTEYEGWDKQLAHEKDMLQRNLHDSQLNKFLENFFLESFTIPGLGSTRKVILASFGIETAADVTRDKIIKIKGFSESLIDEIVDWRKGLERRFMFDSSKGVDPADIAALNQRFAQKRKQMEGTLEAGPEELKQLRELIVQNRTKLQPMLHAAAQLAAQAEADLSLLG
jgi:DNA-binding helix-hairpin-helix protein with protein kinase domain